MKSTDFAQVYANGRCLNYDYYQFDIFKSPQRNVIYEIRGQRKKKYCDQQADKINEANAVKFEALMIVIHGDVCDDDETRGLMTMRPASTLTNQVTIRSFGSGEYFQICMLSLSTAKVLVGD